MQFFASADREDNFLVGLTNQDPTIVSPLNNLFVKCGQWPGLAPAGQTMFVQCAASWPQSQFRYVIIRGFKEYLNFCELEVYKAGLRHFF